MNKNERIYHKKNDDNDDYEEWKRDEDEKNNDYMKTRTRVTTGTTMARKLFVKFLKHEIKLFNYITKFQLHYIYLRFNCNSSIHLTQCN